MKWLTLFGLLALAPCMSQAERPERIITLSSAITETVFKLGAGHRIIATDNDSHHPPAASVLPKIGQSSSLQSKQLLALQPDLVIAEESAQPGQVFAELRASGVPVKIVQFGPDITQALGAIEKVGEIIGSSSSGRWLARDNRRALERLHRRYANADDKPHVLVVQDGPGSTPMIGSKSRNAERMIVLAGGINLIAENKQPERPSAATHGKLQPDVILVAAEGWSASANVDHMLEDTGLAANLAKRDGRIVIMPSTLLLSMGPRIGSAAVELAELMREELDTEEGE